MREQARAWLICITLKETRGSYEVFMKTLFWQNMPVFWNWNIQERWLDFDVVGMWPWHCQISSLVPWDLNPWLLGIPSAGLIRVESMSSLESKHSAAHQPGLPGLPACGTATPTDHFHGLHDPENLCHEDHGGQSSSPFPREFKQLGVLPWIKLKSYFKALCVKWNCLSLPIS